MDWRSDSWMAGPAPPGAGAGTVAGVEEEVVELLLVVVVVVEVDDVRVVSLDREGPEPAACLVRPDEAPPPSSELRLEMLLPPPPPPPRLPPNSCMSCLWSMLFSRLCSSLSPRLLKSRLPGRPPGRPPSTPPLPPPPDLELPGAGGLLRKSFTFLQNSSSLSVFGSCIQKNIFLSFPLNLSTNTLPVVQAGTALNSTSSGIRMRSSSTLPLVRSFHCRCISWSSLWVTISRPFLLSGLTIFVVSLNVIFPHLNSTKDDLAGARPPEEEPNRGPPTAIITQVLRWSLVEVNQAILAW